MSDRGWEVEVDRVTSPEWSEMLDLFSDANVYQAWSYGAVRWGVKNLSHLVVKCGGEVVGIAQVRIARPTKLKFGIAYLRWGPLWDRRGMPAARDVSVRMAQALKHEYVGERKLFLQVLPNAFAGTPRAAEFDAAFGSFRREGAGPQTPYRTMILDLAPRVEELRKGLDKKWRNLLASAEKKNLTVSAGNGVEAYRRFAQIYRQMRERKAFDSTVDVEEFERIQQELPERHRMRILICEEGGVPVAGVVASAIGDTAIYLLGATSDQGLHSRGSYLLQWSLIQWLKQEGYRWYDLGGINPERNPGVCHFKRGLSGADVTQISPLTCSTSVVSTATARAGLAISRMLRSYKAAFSPDRSRHPAGELS